MNWDARACFWTRHLGLVLVVAQARDFTIAVRSEETLPSLAHAKNAAVSSAARLVRVCS